MGWETRRGGRRYFYYKQRIEGRPCSTYGGNGPYMEAIAALDTARKARGAADREACKEEQRSVRAVDQEAQQHFQAVQRLFRQRMLSLGYHRPKRDRWRKKRMTEVIEAKAKPLTTQERNVLMDKAKKGDHAASAAVFKDADARGFTATIVETLCDRRDTALTTYYKDLLFREAFRRKMEQMIQDLTRESDTEVERLLIESVVLCWLRVEQSEVQLAKAMTGGGSNLPETLLFFDKMLDRAHRRYLQALQSLAAVRRLQLPALQVNIGQKQVNLIQSGGEVTP